MRTLWVLALIMLILYSFSSPAKKVEGFAEDDEEDDYANDALLGDEEDEAVDESESAKSPKTDSTGAKSAKTGGGAGRSARGGDGSAAGSARVKPPRTRSLDSDTKSAGMKTPEYDDLEGDGDFEEDLGKGAGVGASGASGSSGSSGSSDSSCPSGTLKDCMDLCPSEKEAFKACVQSCTKRC